MGWLKFMACMVGLGSLLGFETLTCGICFPIMESVPAEQISIAWIINKYKRCNGLCLDVRACIVINSPSYPNPVISSHVDIQHLGTGVIWFVLHIVYYEHS